MPHAVPDMHFGLRRRRSDEQMFALHDGAHREVARAADEQRRRKLCENFRRCCREPRSGSSAFAPAKYGRSCSFITAFGAGSPVSTGVTQRESPPNSATELQNVPIAPGSGIFFDDEPRNRFAGQNAAGRAAIYTDVFGRIILQQRVVDRGDVFTGRGEFVFRTFAVIDGDTLMRPTLATGIASTSPPEPAPHRNAPPCRLISTRCFCVVGDALLRRHDLRRRRRRFF